MTSPPLGSPGPTTEADVIELLSRQPDRTGVFTDFDGTLALIVPDPDSARPVANVRGVLSRLASVLARVAVVSGRPAAFLATQLDSGPAHRLELFGLHGLERWGRGASEPVDAVRPFTGALGAARRQLEAALRDAARYDGVVVEDKTFGLTLHWRRASRPDEAGAAGRALASEIARSTGLEARPGKASVELVPPVGIDKGTVVREEGHGLAAVAFLGDDVGDLRAFDALDALADNGAAVARIAVAGTEAPAELLERADLVLEGPYEAAGLLSGLAERLGRGTGPAPGARRGS